MSPWELMVYMFAFAGGLFVNGFVVALVWAMIRGVNNPRQKRKAENATRII